MQGAKNKNTCSNKKNSACQRKLNRCKYKPKDTIWKKGWLELHHTHKPFTKFNLWQKEKLEIISGRFIKEHILPKVFIINFWPNLGLCYVRQKCNHKRHKFCIWNKKNKGFFEEFRSKNFDRFQAYSWFQYSFTLYFDDNWAHSKNRFSFN